MKFFTAVVLSLAFSSALAQDEHFIYGRITMNDSKVYEGPIRWGKEEVYWNDIFNASKLRNENLRFLTGDERDHLIDRLHEYNHRHDDWDHWGRWADSFNWRGSDDDDHYDFVHQFSCQFGDIKSIKPQGSKWVDLELRNGTKVELSGEGYNRSEERR